MVTKIFLAMALIIGGGLILQARADARREEHALKMETRDAANTYASLIVGSIEHAMLEGEVIYGAIGHEDRMDFTVIGDVVNTGARLCAVAAPAEIIVTKAVRVACSDVEGFVFDAGEPLELKGKSAPVENYRVRGKA